MKTKFVTYCGHLPLETVAMVLVTLWEEKQVDKVGVCFKLMIVDVCFWCCVANVV